MKKWEEMPAHARVWIYAADRFLSAEEVALAQEEVKRFVGEWSAHGAALAASGVVSKNVFVLLAADEEQALASGCSIDSSVHFIKALGEKLGVDFFNRMLTQYEEDGILKLVKLNEFWAMRKAGLVSDDTLVYNNLVANMEECRTSWCVPFHKSWHGSMWH